MIAVAESLEVEPLTGFTGARVRGVDLAAPLDDPLAARLRARLDRQTR